MSDEELANKVQLTLKAVEAHAVLPHYGASTTRMLSVDQAMTDLDIFYRKYYASRFKTELDAEKQFIQDGMYKLILQVAERAAK